MVKSKPFASERQRISQCVNVVRLFSHFPPMFSIVTDGNQAAKVRFSQRFAVVRS